jgi:hypothetical protein
MAQHLLVWKTHSLVQAHHVGNFNEPQFYCIRLSYIYEWLEGEKFLYLHGESTMNSRKWLLETE